MIHVHANMTQKIDDTIQIMYSDDQTGIVIPENHMLLQAMLFEKSYEDAVKHTEKLFNMSEKKQLLESNFSKK
jgi:glyceraldehyde-3-phosphate dehydrogenase (NAD(P))